MTKTTDDRAGTLETRVTAVSAGFLHQAAQTVQLARSSPRRGFLRAARSRARKSYPAISPAAPCGGGGARHRITRPRPQAMHSPAPAIVVT